MICGFETVRKMKEDIDVVLCFKDLFVDICCRENLWSWMGKCSVQRLPVWLSSGSYQRDFTPELIHFLNLLKNGSQHNSDSFW